MVKNSTVYLLLGSNIGDRLSFFNKTIRLLNKYCGTVTNQSLVYETEPWGTEGQSAYLNQAIEMNTRLSPFKLGNTTKRIEKLLGRRAKGDYQPRTIDIDILFYDAAIINSHNYTIPHPKIQDRNFVLVPMNEIASSYMHPVLKKTINALLNDCSDNLNVSIFES